MEKVDMSKVTTNVPLRAVALAVLTFLSACAGGGAPAGLPSAQVAARVPPVPPDRSRIYFYRDDDPYPSQDTGITLNGEVTGVCEPGGVLYRDMPPGKYLVATSHEPLYPHEDRTISIAGGQTTFVKIESLKSSPSGAASDQPDAFVVVIVDPADGQRAIASNFAGVARRTAWRHAAFYRGAY
jgi:hypothetical protein